MDTEFLAGVEKALTYLRSRRYAQLGQLSLSKTPLVQKRISSTESVADVFVGKTLFTVLEETVESLRPLTGEEDVNQTDWQQYILLRHYYILALSRDRIQYKLAVGRARFFEIRRGAIDSLAFELWDLLNEESSSSEAVLCDLPRPLYEHYVPRHNAKGQDYVEMVVDWLVGTRVVYITIAGYPGVGKTTLAFEVANRCCRQKHFDAVTWVTARAVTAYQPDRPVSVEESITSFSSMLDKIGKTFEHRHVLSAITVEEKIQAIHRVLLRESCLIVIDGAEFFPQGELDDIFAFLERLPGKSKALLTSSKQLNIGRSIVLPGMAEEEAIKFMRYEAEKRDLPRIDTQTEKNIFMVTGGIPLAMQFFLGEMAVRGFTPDAIVQHEGEELTEEAYKRLLARMLENAYAHLDTGDRQVFHTMAIFPEPATKEAIIRACGLRAVDVVIGLGHLYLRFLVEKDSSSRYALLPTTKAFLHGLELEGQSIGADKQIQMLLQEYRLNLTRYCVDKLESTNVQEQLDFLRQSRQTVLEMLRWCYGSREIDDFLALLNASGTILGTLGYSNERLKWGERAVETCQDLGRLEQAEWFRVHDVAWTKVRMGKTEEGLRMIERSLQTARAKGYRRVEALALRNIGRIQSDSNATNAVSLLKQALEMWEQLDDQEWIAHSAGALGWALYKSANLEEARYHLAHALDLFQKQGNIDGSVGILSELALVEASLGNKREAVAYSDAAIYTAKDIPPPATPYAYALSHRAMLEHMIGGESETISWRAEQAAEIYRKAGSGLHLADEVNWLQQYLGQDAKSA